MKYIFAISTFVATAGSGSLDSANVVDSTPDAVSVVETVSVCEVVVVSTAGSSVVDVVDSSTVA